MLIEIRDGHWTNLQNVKSVYISRAKILETGETKWHVIVESGECYNVTNTGSFETREEAKAFAKKIVEQLDKQK